MAPPSGTGGRSRRLFPCALFLCAQGGSPRRSSSSTFMRWTFPLHPSNDRPLHLPQPTRSAPSEVRNRRLHSNLLSDLRGVGWGLGPRRVKFRSPPARPRLAPSSARPPKSASSPASSPSHATDHPLRRRSAVYLEASRPRAVARVAHLRRPLAPPVKVPCLPR
jgi:hypothetical protein